MLFLFAYFLKKGSSLRLLKGLIPPRSGLHFTVAPRGETHLLCHLFMSFIVSISLCWSSLFTVCRPFLVYYDITVTPAEPGTSGQSHRYLLNVSVNDFLLLSGMLATSRPLVGKRLNKLWYSHTVHSTQQGQGTNSWDTQQLVGELKGIMLSGQSQFLQVTCY